MKNKQQKRTNNGPGFQGHKSIKFDFNNIDIPRLPKVRSHPALLEPPPKNSGNLQSCIECVRHTDTLNFLARDPNIRGVGVAESRAKMRGESDNKFAIGFLVYKKLPKSRVRRGCLLPKHITWKGSPLEVRVLELDGDIHPAQTPCPLTTFAVGACGGSRVSNDVPAAFGPFGTFCGSWDALLGSGRRGLTNAHVAIGLTLQNFLAGLPGSIGRLFQSPSGEEIFTNALGAAGNFRIMEIDTVHPMLTPYSLFSATTPIPLVLPPGAFGFVLLDCAAGDVDYQGISAAAPMLPPPPPPPRSPRRGLVGGGRIGRANLFPLPGDQVWSPGGVAFSFGGVLLTNLQLAIGFSPLVVIVDQILSVLDIFPGDSGSPLLSTSGNRFNGCRWAGIGPEAFTPGGERFSVTSLATPARLIMTSMDLELI